MENKNKKINLKLEVENFGPISKGKITLKPLTVLIGPNNSGKSYISMLIHSIFDSISSLKGGYFFKDELVNDNFDELYKEGMEIVQELKKMKSKNELDKKKIFDLFLEKIKYRVYQNIYEKVLKNEIVRLYACNLDDLIKIGKKEFKFYIEYDIHQVELAYNKGKTLKIENFFESGLTNDKKFIDLYPKIDFNEEQDSIVFTMGSEKTKASTTFKADPEDSTHFEIFLLDLFIGMAYRSLGKDSINCYYLPAARSGILQTHKTLAVSIWKQIPLVGIKKFEIPKFSGIIADFISSIISLPEKKKKFNKLADDLENELIDGEILVRLSQEYRYPEIIYKYHDTEIPLHRSSSSVSEIAPISLYLKYIIKPGDILIIEEPEAHLHPKNQLILAKYIVRLIREGVVVIITTHSKDLLDQLSSFVRLSKINEKLRESKYKYRKDDYLKPEEVSTYVFEYNDESKGFNIKSVAVNGNDGISDEEFKKVTKVLYEESINLIRDLESN